MSNDKKRWLILFAGILANLCQGAAYASSVFAKPMLAHLGLMVAGPDGQMVPDMTKWAMAFSINLACLPIGMLLSGKIADQRSTKLVVVCGGILFGLGMFLAGYANSLATLYITFGVMMGLGSGAAYGAIVSTAVRWFPDKRGLASGLAVGALGFGPAVIAPVAMWLMSMPSDQATAVLFAFKVLGVAFLAIIALTSLVMSNPPDGYKPANFSPAATVKTGGNTGKDFVWTSMLKEGRFWLLYVLYACGAFSGLMIISQMSPIAQAKDLAGLTKEAAAGVVSFLAMANAVGRVFWGFVSDKIGRLMSLILMFLITAAAMFMMPSMAKDQSTLIVTVLFIGLCYGGYLGIFPSLCADAFGGKNMAVNYGLLFSAFSVAAILGPQVGAGINKSQGSYAQAFVIAAAVALVGGILAIVMRLGERKSVVT